MTIPDLAGHDGASQYTNIAYFTKGGMGEVYKATDTATGKTVAIKLIPVTSAEEEELLTRELDISTKLSAKNLVKTEFTGKVNLHGVEYLYVVQPFYVRGNLRSEIKPNVSLDACLAMFGDILQGFQAAHKLIVHRDIKPENILIDEDGSLVISDFGLAKFIDEKTRTNSYKGSGTIPYMAPECWLSETNSISMDIYSAGILFYEILTGTLPFNGANVAEWKDFHVYGKMPDPLLIRGDLPVKIRQIVSKMTNKRVAERYKSAEEVLTSLNEAITHVGAERAEAERLAAIGHITLQQLQAEQLEENRKKDEILEIKKMLNYHITELFDLVKGIANNVNSSLETTKIRIEENTAAGEVNTRRLVLTFNGKRLVFSFGEWNLVKQYEQNQVQLCRNHNKREGRFFAPPLPESKLSKESIVLIGKAEVETTPEFGFNLLLKKVHDDNYGSWHIASFSDSGLGRGNRKQFPLEYGDFLEHFELSFIMHILTVDYHNLHDADLNRCIEHILRS